MNYHLMMRFHRISIITALLLFTAWTAGCVQPRSLQYMDIQNFKIKNLGISQSVVSADLKYMNPNNFKMQLKRAEMDIYINKRYMGKSVLDTIIDIPKRDSFLLPVSMKVDMAKLLANAVDLLLLHEADVKLEGSVKLGKAGIYKNFPIRYEGKQKVDF
jgi:LEA14-like dessication related protein